MILEIGIGDAYGRPFEFNTPEFIKSNNDLSCYRHRAGEFTNGIGIYTDDTQMSIGVSEQILSELPGTQVRFASHFVTAYKRDPRKGYSKRITKALEDSKENMPFEFILKAKQAGMSSNGSVMRSVPLGLLSDPKEVMHRSIVQTSTSHGHIEAVNSAVFVALTAHFFYHLYSRLDSMKPSEKFNVYEEWMHDQMGSAVFNDIYDSYELHADWKDNKTLLCDSKTTASLSVKLAWGIYDDLYFETHTQVSASRILIEAVSIGGDVDSSASISLGLYSLRQDSNMDLPQFLYDNLENDTYGKDYLVELDAKLMEKFPRNKKTEKTETDLSDFIV